MDYQPMDREEINAVMRTNTPLTEAHFYDMIEEVLNDSVDARAWPYYAMDFVDSREAWENFRSAMTRWLADHDQAARTGFDQAKAEEADAREQRHLKPVKD